MIGSKVRKTFGKLLTNFFCHLRFMRATGNFFAAVSPIVRQPGMGVFSFLVGQ